MAVVMLAGVLAGCGGSDGGGSSSSKHIEMSNSARQAFIDYAESGGLDSFSSAVILDYERNGAPIILYSYPGGEDAEGKDCYDFIYRGYNGVFECRALADAIRGRFNAYDVYLDFENEVVIYRNSYTYASEKYVNIYVKSLKPAEDYIYFKILEHFNASENGSVKLEKISVEDEHDRDVVRDIDTIEKLDKYLEEAYPDAKPAEDFFSGDNVYNSMVELIDAWEEY